jgi:Na+/melibiose symporter-like transporter
MLQLFTGLYYVPFYFMSVKGHSATRSGVDLVPALVFILPGSIIISLLTTQLGKFRWAIWIGWVITTLGSGLLFLLDTNTSVAVGVVPLFIFGIGSGMVLPSVNFAIQAISRVEDCAMSASMYGFFRSLGMPIGVAVSVYHYFVTI